MDIEAFLRKHVDGYLFGDLESLTNVGPLEGKDFGAAGYPTLLTVLSGIELLGAIVYPERLEFGLTRDCNPKQDHFSHYWRSVLNHSTEWLRREGV